MHQISERYARASLPNASLTTQNRTIMENEIVLYQPSESVQLEVRLQNDSVWLSQQQMGELFGVNRQAITKHLKNIYETKELEEAATCSILERMGASPEEILKQVR